MTLRSDLRKAIKAERSAADLAYYFGSTDLTQKYEAQQSVVDKLIASVPVPKRENAGDPDA
jgi:hypothetical protein